MTIKEKVKVIKNDIEVIIKEDDNFFNTNIDFILINPDNNDSISIISDGIEKVVQFTDDTLKYDYISEWSYSFDEYLFENLQQGYQIGYMSDINHYGVWKMIDELYPSDINYKAGVQIYLQYCADNNITKDYIDSKTGFDTPNIMYYFEGLAINEKMEYRGYVIESDDLNCDNPKENLVHIYDNEQDYIDGEERETISLNTIELKQNIKDYIDEVYVDKETMESEKVYFTFVLGYDLLQDVFKCSTVKECDYIYDFCNYEAEKFLRSEEYQNLKYSGYDMLEKWVTKNKELIINDFKEFIGGEFMIYNGNIKIINNGFRKEQPIAFVEKTLSNNEKEYIIAFSYKTKENKIFWDYGYYYGNDKNNAEKDFKKVLNGGNLDKTFRDIGER